MIALVMIIEGRAHSGWSGAIDQNSDKRAGRFGVSGNATCPPPALARAASISLRLPEGT